MIEGIYISAWGMIPALVEQEVVADNLANVGTTGFKRGEVFRRAMVEADFRLRGKWPYGGREVVTVFEQGPLRRTGNPLDLALDGDGFFTVQTPHGVRYTRNGNFTFDHRGVLVTSNGYPVLGENGPIQVWGEEMTKVAVGEDGQVFVDGDLVDRLLLVDFEKPYRLARAGESLFVPRDGAGPGIPISSVKVRQGYLEESNVRAIEEMVKMITIFRRYQSDQVAIKCQDESLKRVINDVGRVK